MTYNYEAWRISFQSSEGAARAAFNRIAELEAQLEAIGAGGVEPLRKREAATDRDTHFYLAGWNGARSDADPNAHFQSAMKAAPPAQAQEDALSAALQDSAYAAGMLTGWNLCIDDDEATFNRVRGERMRAAVQVVKAARAAQGGAI